ncbi:regulatory GntR family protein [Hoeflea marina]|uniref:Regulatory GntR family protein n=1 Tax=Hoeflea marina TaxID=274592 RepID=A0A317PQD3_9HYPH|nr:GntR family transcriptional regulator [Hoeflea marina]PWW03691.1 regulatory GntR family protein [Hoeflea marina]
MREKTRVDVIYETLRDRICLGEYPAGTVFREQELGQEFMVSRTPIRQVLQRLAFEKLAVVRTGVGTLVEGYPAGMAGNYLALYANMLSTVASLGLVADCGDLEEAATTLQGRATRLSASTEPARFWLVLKTVHEIGSGFYSDDLPKHMDELLFYRSSPAVMEGVVRDRSKAADLFRQNASDLVTALDAGDRAGFFRSQAANVLRLTALVSNPG